MTDPDDLLQWRCSRLFEVHPYVRDFLSACGIHAHARARTMEQLLAGLDDDRLAALGMDRDELADQFRAFVAQMERSRQSRNVTIDTITVVGGRDKSGRAEQLRLDLNAGEVVAVVGPTGAGKSLLLSDIECLAQGDTPSERKILIDGRPPDEARRLAGEHRLVAQLSQNMNFVMDLSVEEFLTMHAESRLVPDAAAVTAQVLETAVGLAGEPFDGTTAVTSLSGGQSRALMIADVACLSASPVVLIDEIENAGVDRRRALELLVKKEKIVLMATHDPLLALSGHRRLVIRNGGIAAVLQTTAEEKAVLHHLETMDARLADLRHRIRQGEQLNGAQNF